MAVAAGQSFGNFQVVRLLGEGGFGEVYEAENPFLQRRAAIKIMHTGMDQDPELVRRFLNEARAASAIRHPNIIDVFDAGITPEGEPYILMEFLEGDSLQKVLLAQGPLPAATVVEIARQAGSALAAAHGAGIVHRDLKPENLHLVPDASQPMGFRVKVLDFGIAKIKQGDEKTSTLKTQAGLLMGSPSYMSPEQCRDSSDVDLRSDIYSFGIILYEMLAGVPPFVSQSATEMIVMQITAEPPSLRQYVADVPEHVELSVMRALAKDREKRFPTMDYFVGALAGTYPPLTALGNATPAPGLDGLPRQSLYSRQGFGYQRTPTPLLLGGPGARSNRTPVPTAQPTLTTLSHATGESRVASAEAWSDGDLDAIRPKRWPIWVGLGVVAAAGGLVFALTRGSAASVPRSAPPASAVVAPTRTPPQATASVRLQIRSTPAGATVADEKSGQVLGVTPLVSSRARSDSSLDLVIRLAGYKDRAVSVGLDGDSTTAVDLEREAPELAPAPANAAERPVRKKAPTAARPPRAKPAKEQFREDEWLVH